MAKRLMTGILFVAFLVPLSLQAGMFGWFGKKDSGEAAGALSSNMVKRLHLKIADKNVEKELLQLTAVKRILVQEQQVLIMLSEEKRRNVTTFDAEFERAFGIRRDRNYHYDAKTMTVYERVERKSASTNSQESAVESLVLKKLASESDSRKFASLAAAKQMTQEDIVVLARILREKTAALGQVEDSLKAKFSMSRDRNYWYDGKAMRLYELVNPSSKGEVQ